MARQSIQEKEKKIKQLRAELKRTEGENCGKPDKLMAKIAEKEKNNPEPEARFKTSKNKQKVVFITILPCFY